MIATEEIPLPVTGREAVAPTWAYSRGEHMGRNVMALAAADADNPREHHRTVEAEIAEGIVALAVKDCEVFLARQKPTRREAESAISAAGFLGARRGRVMTEHLTGERGVELALVLARRVKARVLAHYVDVLIDMGHVPRETHVAGNRWDGSVPRQPDLFAVAA